jgi:hypothetical protein
MKFADKITPGGMIYMPILKEMINLGVLKFLLRKIIYVYRDQGDLFANFSYFSIRTFKNSPEMIYVYVTASVV